MFEITRDLIRFKLKIYLKGTPKGIKFMVINTEEQLEKAVFKSKNNKFRRHKHITSNKHGKYV